MGLLSKVFSMKWHYVLPLLRQAQQESHRGFFDLLKDLYRCYQQGYTWCEYFDYGFQFRQEEHYRKSFVATSIHYPRLSRLHPVSQDARAYFDDKAAFNRNFADLKGMETLDLADCELDELRSFLERHERVVQKTTGGYGGYEVRFLETVELLSSDLAQFLQSSRETGYRVLEPFVQQHPSVSQLSLKSVNTLRLVTVRHQNGQLSCPFVTSRISVGKGYTDNGSQGGAWTVLSKEGKVVAPYFSDVPTLQFYEQHPETGFSYLGYEFPYFQESVDLCLRAAERCEAVLIGWDVAITETGPVLIECNRAPGPTLYQRYDQLFGDGGALSILEEALGLSLT